MARSLAPQRSIPHMRTMSDKPDNDWKKSAAIAAGAAVGSAAIAAALLFVNKRRKDKAGSQPPATGKAPHFPPETD
jgi:Na+/H+-translocating membrane pyrophosphatase